MNVDSAGMHYNEVYQDLHYWYDAVGNITQIRDDAQAVLFYGNSIIEPVKKYTYDALYRLIRSEGREQMGSNSFGAADNYADAGNIVSSSNPSAVQNYTQTYEYDGAGNITTLVHNATSKSYTRTFSYAGDSNRLLQSDVVTTVTTPYTYTYDARGNMLSMPHLQTMDWNQENQLSHIVAGTTQAFYQYSSGHRIRKVVVNSGITEERIYLGSVEIYRRFDSTSSLTLERTTVHISDDTGRIAMLETRTFGTDASEAELKRFIYSNHLQSASLELAGNGDIISYEEYHPYGTTSYQAKSATINATAKRYRYTGKERDDESGLNYHGARYYALWLARWISVDPLEAKYMPLSAYNYGFNNPVSYSDPSGMGPTLPTSPVNKYGEKQVSKEVQFVDNGIGGVGTETKKIVPSGAYPISKGISKTDLYRLAVGRLLHPGDKEFQIGNDQYLDEKYFEIEENVKYYFSHLATSTMADSKESREVTKAVHNDVVSALFSNDKAKYEAAVEMIDRRTTFFGKRNLAIDIALLVDGGSLNSLIKSTVKSIIKKASEQVPKNTFERMFLRVMNQLDDKVIIGSNKPIENAEKTRRLGEIDFLAKTDKVYIIEVTMGDGGKKYRQITRNIKPYVSEEVFYMDQEYLMV